MLYVGNKYRDKGSKFRGTDSSWTKTMEDRK